MAKPKRYQRQEENNKPKPRGFAGLRRTDALIIGISSLVILIYGLSQCGGSSSASSEAVSTVDSTQVDSSALTNPTASAQPQIIRRREPMNLDDAKILYMRRSLYVTIDSLRMRSGPSLDSLSLGYLRKGEEVYDLGEFTSYKEEIRFGPDDVRKAPWIKIQTSKGKEAWVYGEGLHFYPKDEE